MSSQTEATGEAARDATGASLSPCGRKGCKNPGISCASKNCVKFICEDCFRQRVPTWYKCKDETELPVKLEALNPAIISCTKRCLDTVLARGRRQKESKMLWEEDGPKGAKDSNNSMAMLLDWLTTQGNYERWRGSKDGKTKDKICHLISKKIAKAGVLCHRSAAAIRKKIEKIEGTYAKTEHWINHTGQGVLAEGNKDSFDEYVNKLCPYYDQLHPIFNDRAKFNPVFTSDMQDDMQYDDEDASGTAGTGCDNTNGDDDSSEESDTSKNSNMDDNTSRGGSTTTSIPQRIICTESIDEASAIMTSKPQQKEVVAATPLTNNKEKRKHDAASASSRRSKGSKNSAKQESILFQSFAENSESSVTEMKRHHLEVESIEWDKIQWSQKEDRLRYQMELFKNYQQLKGVMSREKIRKNFPDMAAYFTDSEDEDVQHRPRKLYKSNSPSDEDE